VHDQKRPTWDLYVWRDTQSYRLMPGRKFQENSAILEAHKDFCYEANELTQKWIIYMLIGQLIALKSKFKQD
jgi:hypothetical protein